MEVPIFASIDAYVFLNSYFFKFFRNATQSNNPRRYSVLREIGRFLIGCPKSESRQIYDPTRNGTRLGLKSPNFDCISPKPRRFTPNSCKALNWDPLVNSKK